MRRKRIGLVGARGHTGAELIRLIAGHEGLALDFVSSREWVGQPVSDQVQGYAVDLRYESLDADATVARELREQVQARLQAEFQQQPVRFSLDSAAATETGKRYTRIEARGIADFGREGTTPADIHALYDRRDRTWVRIVYELGTTANRQSIASGG